MVNLGVCSGTIEVQMPRAVRRAWHVLVPAVVPSTSLNLPKVDHSKYAIENLSPTPIRQSIAQHPSMPPKIVYGKKRPAPKAQTSFTKFLSPDKRDVTPRIAATNATLVEDDEWRQQLEDAAQTVTSGAASCPDDSDVVALENGLGKLQLEHTQETTAEERTIGKKKKKRKPQSMQPKGKTDKTKKDVGSIDNELDLYMQTLTIDDEALEEVAQCNKSNKPRKALEDRDPNATKDAALHINDVQKEQVPKTKVEVRIPARTQKASRRVEPLSSSPPRQAPMQITEPKTERENVFFAYVSPLIALSDRKEVLSFADWSAELEPHFKITKIAEASFSEVYRLAAISPTNGIKQESVLKVVALKTPPGVPLPCQQQPRAVRDRDGQMAKEMAMRDEKDQWKSHVADVLSEVKLLQNLNHIPGFTVFRDLTIVQGRPSAAVNDAWKSWNKSRPRGKKSEFPDPSKKNSYDDTQLWAVVEMEDAGTDCEKITEHGGLTSIWEVWDVFWGVCLSIAKAEEACGFEHRDLHLGNICVRSSRSAGDIMATQVHDPLRRKLRFTGLETTVIDYTLSRADILASTSRHSSSISCVSNTTSGSDSELPEMDVAYLDLDKDPALFEGDASEEYQYEIYRYMRGAALYNKPLQSAPTPQPNPPLTPRRSPKKNTHIRFSGSDDDEPVAPRRSPRKHPSTEPILAKQPPPTTTTTTNTNTDVWKSFHPKTNLVWAHFLLHKLLKHLDYHNATPTAQSLKQIIENIAPSSSDEELDAQKIKKKALKLFKILQRVSELLCPVALGREEGLGSMKELVVLALEERWVRVGDVAG
jgi:serine/threonine-protein kinase haspin